MDRNDLFGAMESNSSKNRIQGFAALARSKRSRTYFLPVRHRQGLAGSKTLTDFSLAPIYLFKISGPLTLMKFSPHSFATAEARSVFPHPGNPYKSKLSYCCQLWIGGTIDQTYPDLSLNGDCAKIGPYFEGHSSVSRRTLRVSRRPSDM